jgi:WD40 repeat protein
LQQEISFEGWVRCAITFDIDNDKNNEFAIGSGDNSLRIFKLGKDDKFEELWRFDFEKNVSAVAAGDINGDGRIEIIAGSWDQSLRVFDGLTGSFLWALEFPEWVTYLKVLDVNWDGFQEIVVGLKKGGFGIINGFTGECIWEYQFEKKINDCDLVYLANNEFPHLLVGGDEPNLYIFDYLGNLKAKIDVEDRILSIDKGDINGDCFNEIVIGLGDNKLLVLESPPIEEKSDETQENVQLRVRWKARLPNVATGIRVYDLYGDGVPRIIITGYFQEIKIWFDNIVCGLLSFVPYSL